MSIPISIIIPIKTISPNKKEHWNKTHLRNKQHRLIINSYLNRNVHNFSLPCNITLTRIASRQLDDDNLRMAFKGIRDIIADYLIPGKASGQADSDSRLSWNYTQQKGQQSEYAIQVTICQELNVK